METYLLNWNPKRWEWFELAEEIALLEEVGWLDSRWSCGVTKRIRPGDRFFLIRLGKAPKGIIGSGWIVSEPFEAPHWDEDLNESGRYARFVDVVFDSLLNPEVEEILGLNYLEQDPNLNRMNWVTQASGVRIPNEIAKTLNEVWSNFVTVSIPHITIGEPALKQYKEGFVKEIKLTIYERNLAARTFCLEYHGARCAVCGFDFRSFYGLIGEGYIHVHHIVPISEIRNEYLLDPIKDLIPVCPNCHAIIHRRKPAYSIEEVRAFIAQTRK